MKANSASSPRRLRVGGLWFFREGSSDCFFMGQIEKGAGCAFFFLFLLDFVFGIFWPDDARGIAGK
jgi:hypothetical protein